MDLVSVMSAETTMTEDEFGRGLQLGEVLGSLKSLTTQVEGLAIDMQRMQRTLAALTGGHKALLWVFSALGVIVGFLTTLYSGVLNRPH